MGATRIIVLAVAAVFAIGLALIVRGLAGHKPPPQAAVAQAEAMSQVLVARRDLPIGTALATGDLGWQPWPASSLNPSFITDGAAPQTSATPARTTADHAVAAVVGGPLEARYGAIVREAILANEPITDAKLVRGGVGGYMAVVLHPGMRAVAVPISASTAAGGFILPGDRVDLIQSHADSASNGASHGPVTQVLLRNIRVLAIDQGAQAQKNAQSMVGAVATLEVADSDTGLIAHAKAQGDIMLALRAYSDAGGPSGRMTRGGDDNGVVRILRNGQPSEVTVAQ